MTVEEDGIVALLSKGCKELGLEIDSGHLGQLTIYQQELLRWSRKMNLVGKKQRSEQIVESHFLDSLALTPFLKEARSLADIGSGAGFPGLVCAVILPKTEVVLVEPRLKRVSFLRHIIRTLKLENVRVIADKVESLEDISFSHITGRAVADITLFCTMIEHLVEDDTEILCMKGPRWKEELEDSTVYLKSVGLDLVESHEFALPFSDAVRSILRIKRTDYR